MEFIADTEPIELGELREKILDGSATPEQIVFASIIRILNLALALVGGYGGMTEDSTEEGYDKAMLVKMPTPSLAAFMQALFVLRMIQPDTQRVADLMRSEGGASFDPVVMLRLDELPDLRGHEGSTEEMADAYLATLQEESRIAAIKAHEEMLERMEAMLPEDMLLMENDTQQVEVDGEVFVVPKKGEEA